MRALAFALVCAVAVSAPGAPIPKPKDTLFFKPGWDRPIDPDKDCKFTFKESSLTIDIPAKVHDLYANFQRANAPRLLRNVEGDFVLQCRVSADFHATEKSNERAGQPAHTAAGLILVDGDNSFRLEFGHCRYKTAMPTLGQVYNSPRGRSGTWSVDGLTYWALPRNAKSAYLRLERRGKYLYPAVSGDGKKWHLLPYFELNYAKKLLVGVIATSSSQAPLKVTFGHFNLTKPEAGSQPEHKRAAQQ
jgi:regulation of enolase protein 1 (concanavalin A-like superfamily)